MASAYRSRRRLASQRRKERDRLVATTHGLCRSDRRPSQRRVALSASRFVCGMGRDRWFDRALLGHPTAEDIAELLRRGFPLHAGLRGEMLVAYRRERSRQRRHHIGVALNSARKGETFEIMFFPRPYDATTTANTKGTR